MKIYQVAHIGGGSVENAIFTSRPEAERIAAAVWSDMPHQKRETHTVSVWAFDADLSKLRGDYLAEFGLTRETDPRDIPIETWEDILYFHDRVVLSDKISVVEYP